MHSITFNGLNPNQKSFVVAALATLSPPPVVSNITDDGVNLIYTVDRQITSAEESVLVSFLAQKAITVTGA